MTNPNFKFEPKENTSKIIWKYLSSSNLLTSFNEVDTEDLKKFLQLKKLFIIKIIQKKIFLIYIKDFNLILTNF